MSKSSPLPSLEPRRKGEKRKEGREKFLERGHQKLLGIIKHNENVTAGVQPGLDPGYPRCDSVGD